MGMNYRSGRVEVLVVHKLLLLGLIMVLSIEISSLIMQQSNSRKPLLPQMG